MITKDELIQKLTNYTAEHGMMVLGAILILIIGFWFAKILSRATARIMESKVNLDPLIEKVMVRCVYLLVVALTIITVLGQFGVETTSFIALLGASGIAVGLALQGTLSNVASGIMLLALRPFSVGHSVKIGGKVIIVDELGLFVTQAHEADGPSVMIPNSKIWGSEIVNYSVTDRDMRRLNETVGIAYEDDIDKAIRTIQSVIDGDMRVLKDEPTRVDVVSLGDSSVNIIVQAWYKREDWWQSKLDFTKNLKLALDDAGISIPYPQSEVHLKGSANG